jgi:hypothetical protein
VSSRISCTRAAEGKGIDRLADSSATILMLCRR